MKRLLFISFLICSLNLFAQKPCDISVNVTDSIGSYKTTKDYLVYEKNFDGKSKYIFTSLVLTDGMPTLNIQFIEKSKSFIKAHCFDKNSKIYIQLNSGKIVSLIHVDKEDCSTLLRDDKGFDNRVLTGYFMFQKEGYEELKKSPVTYIRIKYTTDTEDYMFKKELKSELDGVTYQPENYFVDFLHCVEQSN